jgi:hypothetical protein
MKKTPQKLVLHSDTLRTLATMDLTRAVGGAASGRCADVFDTGAAVCEAPHVGVATAACR